MIKNLKDILKQINIFEDYLKSRNFEFDECGKPVFKKEYFLDKEPELIVPFGMRNNKRVINKKKTVLCFYCKDKLIYPRLYQVFTEIKVYKEYMGVVSPDVTVTSDMDVEWQRLIILLNQLFLAVLCINGIKIIYNTRIGSKESLDMIRNIPKGIMCASGFLGCDKESKSNSDVLYCDKILSLLPSKILIYGKNDESVDKTLTILGLDYRYYQDFHTLCKKRG